VDPVDAAFAQKLRPDFRINGVSNATQALEALSELSYDAVITDLQMPGGGGQAVLEALATQLSRDSSYRSLVPT